MLEDAFMWGTGLAVVALVGFVIYAGVEESKRPGFELKKADWDCAKTSSWTTFSTTLVGEVVITTPIHHTECVNWRKKGYQDE